MKILVFDKYLGYQMGGAQNSLHSLLKELKGDFKFVGCDVKKSFFAEKYKLSDWKVERIKIKEFPKFPYFEYWFNRKRIKKFILAQEADLLITQGMWGALAVSAFNGKKIYFIRDEYQLNKIAIYQKGIKRFFKLIYLFIQTPFIWRIFKDNKRAIRESDLIIANSSFIAKKIEEKFKRESEIIYPLINLDKIINKDKTGQYITCIGSEIIKGREIIERIAKQMPDNNFMIVGRNFLELEQKNNILYFPWTKNIEEVFKMTKILLIPSVINEAFGRVAIEAINFGVPCIGSNRGGISEVLDKEMLINDIWDIGIWKQKILEVEKDYDKYTQGFEEKSLEFDSSKQVAKFRKIVKDKLSIDL